MVLESRLISIWIVLALASWNTQVAGQEAGDPGVIQVDALLVQVSVEKGVVFIDPVGDAEAPEIDRKLDLLAGQVERHLAMSEEQEDRQLSDEESLYRGSNYARKLVAKIELLLERIAYLGGQDAFTSDVAKAASAFDVPLIKKYLQEKLDLEDQNVAEAAFQLAGFQELGGEYQDAWGNYQKASNLEPDNQLYMDAHGKNEF